MSDDRLNNIENTLSTIKRELREVIEEMFPNIWREMADDRHEYREELADLRKELGEL
jgi:hypothetical protein